MKDEEGVQETVRYDEGQHRSKLIQFNVLDGVYSFVLLVIALQIAAYSFSRGQGEGKARTAGRSRPMLDSGH